jgi:hypothetical protein
MKTSIFDMNFTLPPMVLMTEMTKDMPMGTNHGAGTRIGGCGNC